MMKQDESDTLEQKQHQCVAVQKTMSSKTRMVTSLPEEVEWVRQASKGDQEAFVKLCKSYGSSIYRYLFYKTGNLAAARSLTSETFHMAQESIGSGKWYGSLFGLWLLLIADMVFDRRLQEKMPDISSSTAAHFAGSTGEYTSVSDVFPFKDEEDALWQLAKDLSLAQQRLLVFRHIDHLSFAEIAKRLGRSENVCRQLHYRALTNLKHKAHLFGIWPETRIE